MKILPSRLKKYLFQYLDTRVIFIIDLTLSFLSTVLVLFLVSLFSTSEGFYMGKFAIWWMSASLFASLVSLFAFKNHKVSLKKIVQQV